MSIITKAKRRTFLKLGLGGIATGAIAPHIWVPRVARGATGIPGDKDNHLIVLNLDGGARSVPMFNANVDARWNPYSGSLQPTGCEWWMGGVFENTQYTDTQMLGMDPVPALSEIAGEIAVMATLDHTPGAPTGVGDHTVARNYISSGMEQGGPGLLSHIFASHKYYTQDLGNGPVFPPVLIGGGDATRPFANPRGDTEPLKTTSYQEFAAQSGTGAAGEKQPDWARAFEAGLDDHAKTTHSDFDRSPMARLALGKEAVEAFRSVFTDPALKIADAPAAQSHGISNQQLSAIFGTSLFGYNAALATRFLMEGSTAVLIGDNGWDTHSGEMNAYMMSARTLERILCGFNYVLKMMPHPAGGTYWDRTMVAMITEFGRDNLMGNGYNSGGGSDHTGGPGCRYQAYAVMGGLVSGGKQLGSTDYDSMDLVGDEVHSTQDYLATMLAYLDIDYSDDAIFPSASPIDGLFS